MCGFTTTLTDLPFDTAILTSTTALKAEGFGILRGGQRTFVGYRSVRCSKLPSNTGDPRQGQRHACAT